MPDVVASTLRLTVRGADDAVDLVVPAGTTCDALAGEYAAAVGRPTPPALTTTSGRSLDPRRSVAEVGVEPGDVLYAVDLHSSPGPDPTPGVDGPHKVPPSRTGMDTAVTPAVTPLVTPVIAGLLAGAAVLAAMLGPADRGWAAAPAGGLLILAAGAVGVAAAVGVPTALRAVPVAPALGGAGGLLVLVGPAPGRLQLAVTGAAVLVAVVAAGLSAVAAAPLVRLLRVWLVGAAVVGLSAAAGLALGTPDRSVWVVLFLAGVVVARLAPYLVVDVPDESLLDIDRLAVTAWSARERPPSRRRRLMIRQAGVVETAHAGQRLLLWTPVAVAAATTVTAAALARWSAAAEPGWDRWGVAVLLVSGGAALALSSRSHRVPGPRRALRAAGTAVLVAAALSTLLVVGVVGTWLTAVGLLVAGLLAVVAGRALGRGWRSLWWARTADVVEGLGVVLAVAALPVASGLSSWVRQLPS
jgi:hypothetical protein